MVKHKDSNLYETLKNDIMYAEGMKACISCGTCTAICPAAKFYDYNPQHIMVKLQSNNINNLIELLCGDEIWYCGQCLSCKTRCPRNNVPGFIISALRSLSQDTGFFAQSEQGKKQLTIKRTVGENILKYGYCVYVDEINLSDHPEQGPVWEWFKKNAQSILKKLGANYKENQKGTLRKISNNDLTELYNILKETGALERFNNIEKYCNEH